MDIYICVGSSCHLKGSYEIINLMKENIKKYSLEDRVNIAAAVCLGKCTDGVCVKIDNEVLCGIFPENFHEFFKETVLKRLNLQNKQDVVCGGDLID
ncbi:MAG: (2Fe-2S) ferredoxin domain-containing protein [Clostridiaceae bacterium]|nr:(2Fe-2S) ferredoxin domain-containing protein [Clostridiaceae bacterium]